MTAVVYDLEVIRRIKHDIECGKRGLAKARQQGMDLSVRLWTAFIEVRVRKLRAVGGKP